MDKELIGKIQLCRRILCNHQKAAGVFVYAVNKNAHALVVSIRPLAYSKMECQCIHKSAVVVTVAGMHHHPGGLVDDHEVVVLVNYVKGDVFRENLKSAALIGHHELDYVLRAHYVICLGGDIVDQHVTGLYGLLDAAAGGVFLMRGNELVYAHRLLAAVCHQTEMLVQDVFFVGHYSGILLVSRVRLRDTLAPRFWRAPGADP